MPAPSPYNRKLKAKNDRRKARAARGGRTPSEAGLAQSMAAAGNKVSKSNQRVGAPATKPKFGKPRKARRTARPDYDSMTLDELARQPNLPERYREAAGLAAERPDYDRIRQTQRIVGEDGKELSRLEMAGQLAEVGSLVIPVGGGVGTAGRILATTGRTAPKVAKGAKTAAKVAGSGKAGSKVKKAVKGAPGKAKNKAAQTGKKAKRNVKALGTKKGASTAAKGAAKAPVRVARSNPAVATGAYSVAADKAGVGDPITQTIAADTRGIIDAVNSPSDALKTAKTTGRAVPGILAGLVATGAAGATTVGRAAIDNVNAATGGRVGKDYTGAEVLSPVSEELAKNWEGSKAIAKPFIEGDEEGVKTVVQDELGFLPIVASPRVISGVRNSRGAQKVRQGVRTKAQERRERNNEEVRQENQKQKVQRGDGKQKKAKVSAEDSRYGGQYAMPRVGRLIEGTRQRGQQAKDAARAKAIADSKTARILRTAEKSFRAIAVPKGKDAGDYRRGAKNAMATVLAYGIPRDYNRAVQWMDDVERGIAMPDNPPKISDKGNFEFLRNNPELFRDENFWKARDFLAKEQDSITTSEVKRYLAAGASLGIKNPDERLAEGVWVGGEPRIVKREVLVDEALTPEQRAAAASALARKNRRDERRAGIADRRTERRRATRQSKNYDATPEAINQREWFHGTNIEGLGSRNLDPDMTSPDSLVGMGTYLTSASVTGKSYGKTRARQRGGGQQLYRARVEVKNPLDLDAPLDPRFRDTLIAFAERVENDELFDDVIAADPRQNPSGAARRAAQEQGITNLDLYSVVREELGALSREKGLEKWEMEDYFSSLRRNLIGEGWDALTHRGGKRTGGRDHQALILLDPSPASVPRFGTRSRPIGPEPRPVSQVPRTRKGRRIQEEVVAEGTLVKRERGRKEDQQLQRDKATLKNLRAGLRAAEKRGDMEEVDRLTPIVARKEKQLRDFTRATRKAQKEFVEETRGAMDARGLESPTYVRSWGDRTDIDQAAPFPSSGTMAQRTWIDRDTTRKKGESERAWDDFVRDSIYKPRAQRIYHDLVSEFASSNAIRLPSGRGTSVFLTRAEVENAIKDGLIGVDDHVVFHSQHFRSAVQDPDKIDPKTGIGAFYRLDDEGRKALATLDNEIRTRAADPGNKYVVVPRAGAEELVKQFVGTGKGALANAANVNRLGSRIILGYNPSWAVAQLVAEGVPAAVAVGANQLRWRRMRQATKERRNNPEQADLFDGTAGQTAGTTVIPKREQGVDTRGREIATSGPVTAPGQVGRFILDTLKGEKLGQFDRLKGGGFRKMVLAAQIDREVNGFLKGFGNYLKLDDQVRQKMKGMTPAEQQAYLLRNPKTAKALEGYLDDVMGNWRAISSNERWASSLVAFYPYVRYALKSAFWGFPKRHPIKSSILYFLAQLNANQLEELVDEGTPLDWVDYAFPVISMDGEQKVAPGAARVAPALSIVAEAVGTNNLSRLFGGLNPIIGAGYRAISGDDFTGEKVADGIDQQLLLGLAALTSMVAPYRILSEELDPDGEQFWSLRSYTPRREYGENGETSVVGGRSETSQALRDVDVDRGLPSLVNPFQLLDDEDFAERKRIIDALNRGAWRELPGSATADSSSSGTPISTWGGSGSSGGTPTSTWKP